jgi:hypothetical protein
MSAQKRGSVRVTQYFVAITFYIFNQDFIRLRTSYFDALVRASNASSIWWMRSTWLSFSYSV